ncbi:MAG: Crp/Fnr family transcriptional regulator [Terriglobales bacterium]
MRNDSDLHADVVRELAEALDAIASVYTCHAGAILFRQGQAADGVLVMRQGKVRLSALTHDHDPRLPYRTVGPGYVLGLPALFSGQPYSLTAEAEEECVCGFVDRERALELVHKRLDLCFQAADLLAREIRSLREWQATHLG